MKYVCTFFSSPKSNFFFWSSIIHALMFFLAPFPSLSLFKILWQKAGIQMMLFRSRSILKGLCERQLLLFPILTTFSTSYWETDTNCRLSLCLKANYLWLCNLINSEVKCRKHKLMDFPLCLLFLSLLQPQSLFYPLSLFLSVTNGTSHSPTALNGAPSPPNGFSNGPSSSSSSSLANQQLPPACGARQLSKLKRFLTTLQQFGNDISPEIGERVRTLVLGLVVSKYFFCCFPSSLLDVFFL